MPFDASLKAWLALSLSAIGALAGWLGLAASYRVSIDYGVRLGSAATVVVVLVACFAVCVAAGPGLRRLRRGSGTRQPVAAGGEL